MILPRLDEKQSQLMLEQIMSEVLIRLGPTEPQCRVLVFGEVPKERIFEKLGRQIEILPAQPGQTHVGPIHRRVVGTLNCSQMADLGQGKAVDAVTAQLLEQLLQGHTIEVLEFEYEAYRNSAPKPLLQLYENYRKQLAGFGLQAFQEATSEAPQQSKKLMTEADVLAAAKQGVRELRLALKTIMTPLAIDCARSHKITIHRETRGRK